MNEEELFNLITKLKQEGEISWVEVKNDLGDVVKIGRFQWKLTNNVNNEITAVNGNNNSLK
jgi:hypothetical protein